MSADLLLVGPLRELAGLLGVTGAPAHLRGRLIGGTQAGIARDGWPRLGTGDDRLAAIRCAMTPALARYAAVFDLSPVDWQGDRVLGVTARTGGEPATGPWDAALAAEIARDILALPTERDARSIVARLPMIAAFAGGRLRARAEAGPPPEDRRIEILAIDQPYAGFFALEEWRLRHSRHDGGMSGPILRAGLVSGDAVVVLPWDPVRDEVLLIEQFRMAPAMRGDPQAWLVETIAGRIDAGETPEAAARREAAEEAGLAIGRLIPAIHHYPSPGALAEFLYLYVAATDLSQAAGGLHGLAAEAEDIRSLIVPRAELTRMAMAGAIRNGPLALLALWLEARAADLAG